MLQVRGQAGEMSKRMKAADSAAAELQRRADDAVHELQTTRTEIQRLSAELGRARAACDEMNAKQDAVNRENKQLTGYNRNRSFDVAKIKRPKYSNKIRKVKK